MMKDRKLSLVLVLFVGALGSCKNPSSADMDVAISPKQAFIIPDASSSCLDVSLGGTTKSLGKSSVRYKSFQITWSGSETISITRITLTFRSAALVGGEKKYSIAGDELEQTLSDLDLSPGQPTSTANPACGLRAGGLQFVNPKSPAQVSVDGRVFAIGVDSGGQEFPVYGEFSASGVYDGE
ncbi:MAG: hypothetical protein ACK5RO_08585 [Pseudobdellovibrionaceae bacterium]